MNVVNYIQENWATLLVAYVAFEKLVRAIVLLTPTPKDDTFVEKVFGFLSKLALITPSKK